MTVSDQGPHWLPECSSFDEPDASWDLPEESPKPRTDPVDPRVAEASLLDVGGPPPKVWAAIEAELRREGLVS